MEHVLDRTLSPVVSRLPAWVTPNAISIVRGLALFPVLMLYRDHPLVAGFGVLLPAMVLDLFDGPLARHRRQTSDIGAFLDATADKVFIHGVLWLALYPRVPLHIAASMSAIDLLLTVIRPLKRRLGAPVAANGFGKVKTVLQSFGVGFLLVRIPILETLGLPILLAAVLLATFSLGWHVADLFRKPAS